MAREMLLSGVGCFLDEPAVVNMISTDWLIRDSSPLLWADHILLTKKDFDILSSGFFQDAPIAQEQAAYLMEAFKKEGLLTTIDEREYFSQFDAETPAKLVRDDMIAHGIEPCEETEEDGGKIPPTIISYEAGGLCAEISRNAYMNLLASQQLGIACLMDEHTARCIINGGCMPSTVGDSRLNVFSDMYPVVLPVLEPFKEYKLFCNPATAAKCGREQDCITYSKKNAEHYANAILAARGTQEIRGLAKLIDEASTSVSADETALMEAVHKDIRRYQQKIRDRWASVGNWSSLITSVATLASGVAFSNGMMATGALSAAAAGGCAALTHHAKEVIRRDDWKLTYAKRIVS